MENTIILEELKECSLIEYSVSDSHFDELMPKTNVKKVGLFSCHGGDGEEGVNVAWEFTQKTDAIVTACEGSVSYLDVPFLGYFARSSLGGFGFWNCFYYEDGEARKKWGSCGL